MKKNQEILRRFIDEAWNKGNLAILEELLTPDFRHYMPGLKDPLVGPEGYRMLLKIFDAAFEQRSMTVDEVFGEQDRVCVQWTFRGSHRGVYDGIEPTGRTIAISGVGVARVREGKIEEVRSVYDTATLSKLLTE